MSKKPKKFLIIGRTSSGKSSLCKKICKELKLKQVKSYTTRPPRKSELSNLDECDHIFIKTEDVQKYVEDMAAYTKIKGNEYFTTFEELDKCDVYVIDPNGVESLKHKCKGKYELVEIYIRCPKDVAIERCKKRGQTKKEFEERYAKEDEQFSSYEKGEKFRWHVLNNGSFEEGVEKLKRVILKAQQE